MLTLGDRKARALARGSSGLGEMAWTEEVLVYLSR